MSEGRRAARWSGRGRVCALLALSLWVGCGVWGGDPIELFPQKSSSFDGGVEPSGDPCIETTQALNRNGDTVVGAPPSELIQLLDGDHVGALQWVSGDMTRVTISIENPRVTSILSRTNPLADEPYSERHCANHVRIDASLKIRTVDGRLDETIGNMRMIAYAGDEARGSFVVTQDALHGTYKPTLRREHCYMSTTVRFLIATDGTHGSTTDQLGASECGPDGGSVGSTDYAAGRWGARWQI